HGNVLSLLLGDQGINDVSSVIAVGKYIDRLSENLIYAKSDFVTALADRLAEIVQKRIGFAQVFRRQGQQDDVKFHTLRTLVDGSMYQSYKRNDCRSHALACPHDWQSAVYMTG